MGRRHRIQSDIIGMAASTPWMGCAGLLRFRCSWQGCGEGEGGGEWGWGPRGGWGPSGGLGLVALVLLVACGMRIVYHKPRSA